MMNRMTKWTTSLALFSSVALGLPATADDETNGPPGPSKDLSQIAGSIPQIEPSAKWSVPAEMPEVPPILPVYQVKPQDPTKPHDVAIALMDRFQFEAEKQDIEEGPNGSLAMLLTDAKGRSVELFESGATFYMEESLFPEQAPDILKTLDLDSKSAQALLEGEATNLLDEIGMKDEGMVFDRVSFAELKTVTDGGDQETVKVIGAAAHFDYQIDGIPAWGPGAKTTVYFGAEGPTGLYDAMPLLEPVSEVKVLPPTQAIAAYIGGSEVPRSNLRLHTGVVDETVIENITLNYYVGPGNESQTLVEPHYLIEGTMYGWNPGPDAENPQKGATEAEPAPFVWLAPASENVPEPGLAMGLLVGVGGLAGLRRPRRTPEC